MKIYFSLLVFLFCSVCLFAAGLSDTACDFSEARITGGKTENSLVSFSRTGELSFEPLFLRNRLYIPTVKLKEGTCRCRINIIFLYKTAYIGEYSQTFFCDGNGSDFSEEKYISVPDRYDRARCVLQFESEGSFVLEKAGFRVLKMPMAMGYFLTPQFDMCLTDDIKTVNYRYFSNHEELGYEDRNVSAVLGIYQGEKKIFEISADYLMPKGFISFKRPKIQYGDYTAKCDFYVKKGKEKELFATDSCDFHVRKVSDYSLYADQNGRLVKKGRLFFMLGIWGKPENIDVSEAEKFGINYFLYDKGNSVSVTDNDFNFAYIKDGYSTEKFGECRNPALTVLDDVSLAPYLVPKTRFMGFWLKDRIFDRTEEFFRNYGFYFPLINIIDTKGNFAKNLWENLAQTQTGIIFRCESKEDFEKIKPYAEFISSYSDIFLSNEEAKSRAFGTVKSLVRKVGKTEYVFVFETLGKECESDVIVPNKKSKVYSEEIQLLPSGKDRTLYTVRLKPYECRVLRIEN